MEFLKMEDMCPRLLLALILRYKRAHTQRKEESRHPRRKTAKKQKKNRIQERD